MSHRRGVVRTREINLSPLRWDDSDWGRKPCMDRGIDRLVFDLIAGGVFSQKVIPFPILRRPDRSRNKPATAVGAHIAEHTFNTRRAKRAFVTANACLQGIRWQGFVAVFASGSELKHGAPDGAPKLLNQSPTPAKRDRTSEFPGSVPVNCAFDSGLRSQ